MSEMFLGAVLGCSGDDCDTWLLTVRWDCCTGDENKGNAAVGARGGEEKENEPLGGGARGGELRSIASGSASSVVCVAGWRCWRLGEGEVEALRLRMGDDESGEGTAGWCWWENRRKVADSGAAESLWVFGVDGGGVKAKEKVGGACAGAGVRGGGVMVMAAGAVANIFGS